MYILLFCLIAYRTWAKLLKLCERKGDYKAYNTAIQRAMRAMENKPHMPYLGLYLQKVIDLTCRWNVVKSDAIEGKIIDV